MNRNESEAMKNIKERDVERDQRGRYVYSKSGRKIYERACQHCGNLYFYARSDQKYCAESCRVTACRKRKGSKDEMLPSTSVTPKTPFGKIGSLTGSELGDLTLGVVAGNVVTGLGKAVFGPKSPELKAIERLEQTLTQKPIPLPVTPNQKTVQFTGFSTPLQRADGTVTSVTEVILDGRAHYLDNAGILYRLENGQLRMAYREGRRLLGLPTRKPGT